MIMMIYFLILLVMMVMMMLMTIDTPQSTTGLVQRPDLGDVCPGLANLFVFFFPAEGNLFPIFNIPTTSPLFEHFGPGKPHCGQKIPKMTLNPTGQI